MEKKYTPSPEAKKFIEDNINLINNNKWEEVLCEASRTNGLQIGELIYLLVSCEIDDKKNIPMTTNLSIALNKIINYYEVFNNALEHLKK